VEVDKRILLTDATGRSTVPAVGKAGIPWDRHRHGHPRRLPREDRRAEVDVPATSPLVQLATSRTLTTDTRVSSRGSSRGCRLYRDARVYTMYACTVHDKLSCTRLQNYMIGASLKSVSVSVSASWNAGLISAAPFTEIFIVPFYLVRRRLKLNFFSAVYNYMR